MNRISQVIAELPVSHPGNGIVVNRRSNQVFVSSASSNGGSVSVFDGSTNLQVSTLTLPGNPSFTYLARLDQFNDLYAITQPAGGGTFSFSLVDETSGALLNQIPLQGKPGGVIAMGISNSEVITNDGISSVEFMFQNASGISCRVQVGRGPAGMGIFYPGSSFEMVVANRLDNTVVLLTPGPVCSASLPLP